MKKLKLMAVCLLGVMLASCSSNGIYRVTSTNRVKNPKVADIYAELEVRPAKMTYVYEASFNRAEVVKEDVVKENAIYEALLKANADVMVSPIFKIEYEEDNRGKYYTITVTGYPADFKKFVQDKAPLTRTGYEVKELKKDASYLVVDKDQNGSTTGYTVVTSTGEVGHSAPAPKHCDAPVLEPKDEGKDVEGGMLPFLKKKK
ncbi:MAG: hypothetical protein IJS05_03540 [Paludibacteraceae bacterium]|nr:hypothetical protein [Paludibacteraceae bacterium]